MKVDDAPSNDSLPLSASAWWGSHSLRYNFGLILAGFTAFVVYCIVLEIFGDVIEDVEVTVFTILFQGIGYLFCMGLANIFYYLGPFSERWLDPKDPAAYRRVVFALGFWFSVALPFVIPALLAFSALFYPSSFHP